MNQYQRPSSFQFDNSTHIAESRQNINMTLYPARPSLPNFLHSPPYRPLRRNSIESQNHGIKKSSPLGKRLPSKSKECISRSRVISYDPPPRYPIRSKCDVSEIEDNDEITSIVYHNGYYYNDNDKIETIKQMQSIMVNYNHAHTTNGFSGTSQSKSHYCPQLYECQHDETRNYLDPIIGMEIVFLNDI